ncbi:MAG: DUF4287 domain-containing protein [Actinomycetales bacterium]|nr:DUF4287 domain-containing protein [Actinomycetales bacterium]
MASNPDRASYFPAIEKRYGMPMSAWFAVMDEIKDRKYPEQIAYLRENHGFSQAHANALVLYSRGSTSARRFDSLAEYLAPCTVEQQATVRAIFAAIQRKYRRLELVIAWNQPMLKSGTQYVFGVSVLKNYLLIAPTGPGIIDEFGPRLAGYRVNKKTIQVPSDWKVDARLLQDMVAARLAQLEPSHGH